MKHLVHGGADLRAFAAKVRSTATITRADRDMLADLLAELLERRGYSSGITARHEYVHRARHGDTD